MSTDTNVTTTESLSRISGGSVVTASAIRSRFMVTPHAATYLGLSPRTMEKHRCYGTGPTYRKLGGRIVYAVEDIEAWAALGMRRSTSDPGNGIVHPAKRRISGE